MANTERPRILIHAPTPAGGLAEHVFYQAGALQRLGAEVHCLAARSFLAGRAVGFPCERRLQDPQPTRKPRWRSRLAQAARLLRNELSLAREVFRRRPQLVVLESFKEYLAPLWVWPHVLAARALRVRYAANLHDPVRDYQVGPAWLHRLSVRLAYWPLDFVLIHDDLPTPSPVPARVRAVKVPVGVYELRRSGDHREAMRLRWGVLPGQHVFLAFGYLRDNKNLDLVLRAAAEVPAAFVVFAGATPSGKDRPFSFYRDLAASLGIANRGHFHEGFVPDEELAGFFDGADVVLLTYAGSFVSQSGVLHVAARARKPVLASAASGPLVNAVRAYGLGVAVAPDDVAAIVSGMRDLLAKPPTPRWEDFEAAAGWDQNAAGILEAAGLRHAAAAPRAQ